MNPLPHPIAADEGHPILAQMRKVEALQIAAEDCARALELCTPAEAERLFPGTSYEDICWSARVEVNELWRLADRYSINLSVVARALEGVR